MKPQKIKSVEIGESNWNPARIELLVKYIDHNGYPKRVPINVTLECELDEMSGALNKDGHWRTFYKWDNTETLDYPRGCYGSVYFTVEEFCNHVSIPFRMGEYYHDENENGVFRNEGWNFSKGCKVPRNRYRRLTDLLKEVIDFVSKKDMRFEFFKEKEYEFV